MIEVLTTTGGQNEKKVGCLAMQGVSLVANWGKDLEKPVNAKRKEISSTSESLAAPAYRIWMEKSYVYREIYEKKILIIFIYIMIFMYLKIVI